MTTKAPSTIKPAPAGTLEQIAYSSVESIPVNEPHERDRLAYYLFLWLQNRKDPLEMVVRSACVRMQIGEDEALKRIRESLTGRGIRF
jgi:hypothetical protein